MQRFKVTRNRRHHQVVRALVFWMIAATAFPLTPSQSQAVGHEVRQVAKAAFDRFHEATALRAGHRQELTAQQNETPGDRAQRVAHIRLCPRQLLLYVGEQFTLVPLPLDNQREPVHGVVFVWESSDSTTADVATDGSITALRSGRCLVTASVGNKKEKVQVEVRDGARPFLSNAQWDVEHGHDCDDPAAAAAANEKAEVDAGGLEVGTQGKRVAPAFTVDNDDPPNLGGAAKPANFVGQSRFSPVVAAEGSKLSKHAQLGSSSYGLDIPIFGAPGRGVRTALSLVYNSRVWTKDSNKMVFDYDQGWPAPGFRLNYGRVIPNYDVAAGFSGNYLLIEAEGTRTPLVSQGGGIYRSDDGRFIEYDANFNALNYPDGTLVLYTFNGSKLVPNLIRNIDGNSISISYVTSCADAQRVEACTCGAGCVRPQRQAINQISDTLGRLVTFYYKADGNLAEIRVPGYNSAPDRTVVKFYYQSLTLSYNFGSMTIINTPPGNQQDVLRRVYFPDTGQGYVFDQYSGYGMCTHVSMRLGMTDSLEGTEVAYSEYAYNQTGPLSDAPEFNQRKEWWQGKTDDSGNLLGPTSPAIYTYGRTPDHSDTWMIAPNQMKSEIITNNNTASSLFGLVTTDKLVRVSDGVTVLQHDYTYNDRTAATGLQRTSVITTDDGAPANQTKVVSTYGSYGRLMELSEQGFPISGIFKPQRRTVYTYNDDPNYLNLSLKQLATDVMVYDAKGTNPISDDSLINRTHYVYDTPDPGWEIETYGLTKNCSPATQPPCTPPPGYNTKFVDRGPRGNVTKLQYWSDATSANPQISFNRKYDIFGNQLSAQVGCCSLKTALFSTAMFYSAAASTTDGPAGGPNLTTSYSYDFNTGFINSVTDPNGLVASFTPDAAMRVRTVSYPSGATFETFYADPNYPNKDGLVYQSKMTYMDGAIQRVQISNRWLDGSGRMVREGSAAGPTPSSYDVVKSIYDEMGRLRKTTNPYNTTSADGDTTGLPNATVYDYDALGRVVQVTMPDSNTVSTSYNGASSIVIDPVGRQRRSETDGLGRVIKVTEMDANKQLTQDTLYGYDMNNNLISVNQGNQTRAYKYDSLSRLLFERTPEQDATINDGSGTLWSVKYLYTDFGALSSKTDARGVTTTYTYDGLNRPSTITYSTAGTTADATAGVTITYGSVVPKLGQVEEVKQTDSLNNIPWKESFQYDSLSRPSSKTVSFDNQSAVYTTSYSYNQASELTRITYPSGRFVDQGYDGRGRLTSLGGTKSYLTSISYTPSQQVGSLSLANGVTESFGYSGDRLQLTSQSASKGASTLLSLSYNYTSTATRNGGTKSGNSGQLMDITTGSQVNGLPRTESYSYDSVGRLQQASGWYTQRSYSYDRWGNRTGVSGGQTQSVSLQPQPGAPAGVPNNRIASVNGGPSYGYDASGDVTSDGLHSYTYDGESRIVKVDLGSTAAYSYDTANRRVKKVTGGFTTYYVWEGGQVIAEYSNAPASGAGTRYYHADRLSNRLMTDSSGLVKGAMDNLPFGEDGGVAGESEKHRFTSYERDSETGMDYAVNRQYASSTARFTRPDPLSGSVLYPQSLNRYAYVGNDPVNSTDPVGLFKEPTWALWAGFGLLANSNITLDGGSVPMYMVSMVAHLWMSGAADIQWSIPAGAFQNARGEWVYNDRIITNPNELWRALPISLQNPPKVTKICIVNVNITNNAGLTADQIRRVQAEISSIYNAAGVNVVFNDPLKGFGGSYDLTIRPQGDASKPKAVGETPAPGGTVLNYGWVSTDKLKASIQEGVDHAMATLGLAAANVATGVGRAGAHEVGHYLLQLTGHPSSGVMKSGFSGQEWWGPAYRDTFRFTKEQAQKLLDRC